MLIEPSESLWSMIPREKQGAVVRALSEAFGVSEVEDFRVPSGGLSSARVFRIVVAGKPYLLRVIVRTDEMGDPTRHFACMKTAAEAGIAPKIWYASVEDRVSITDFVAAKPFPPHSAARMADTIRRLHALPSFPKRINYFDTMDGFVRSFQSARILPESATADLFRFYDELVKVYPRHDPDVVASHNDLKPENIVFDGERVWLVDWEAAFLNDRYVDLAIAANFFVADEAEEAIYLRTYFGEPASEYQLARFFLMRQAMHMFYTAFLMLMVAAAGKPLNEEAELPDFREFLGRIASGEADIATVEGKLQYAMVHRKEALREMRTPRFARALRVVGGTHAGA